MFTPLRIVTSSVISRNKVDSNLGANGTDQGRKEENDDFFKNLDSETQSKIKSDINKKLKMNNKISTKKRNFVNNFDTMKKRIETETRIYHQISLGNPSNSEEKYKIQMSSADKYLNTIHTVKDKLNNAESSTNKISLNNRNWVPGQMVTKIEDISTFDDTSNSNDKEKVFDNIRTVDKGLDTVLYQLPHSMPVAKEVNRKRKTFIEEFNEYKDKYVPNTKAQKRMKIENDLRCFPERKPESGGYNSKIITPFKGLKTSFFADVNRTGTVTSKAGSSKKQDRRKKDITSDWVKGELIKREQNCTNNFNETMRVKHHVPERKIALDYQSNNNSGENETPAFRDASTTCRYTAFDEEKITTRNRSCNKTVSDSVEYSREIVITKMEISKINFPSHLFVFNN